MHLKIYNICAIYAYGGPMQSWRSWGVEWDTVVSSMAKFLCNPSYHPAVRIRAAIHLAFKQLCANQIPKA